MLCIDILTSELIGGSDTLNVIADFRPTRKYG